MCVGVCGCVWVCVCVCVIVCVCVCVCECFFFVVVVFCVHVEASRNLVFSLNSGAHFGSTTNKD